MGFYDHWLRVDTWTFKDAALLFNGYDPARRREINWNADIHSLDRSDVSDWEFEVLKTYQIFSRADWRGLDKKASLHEQTHREHYFILAIDKALPIEKKLKERKFELEHEVRHSKAMINALVEHSNKSKRSSNAQQISDNMRDTLAEIIEAIEDFEGSDVFKEYGVKTQQQLIEGWLKNRGNPRAWRLTVKSLISKHYGIKSLGKKNSANK